MYRIIFFEPRRAIDAAGLDPLDRAAVEVDNAERDIRGPKQVACGVAHVTEQPIGIFFARQFKTDIVQRPQAGIRDPQIVGLLG